MICAIYCRLSKEDENSRQESESIQNQKSLLINHAVRQRWDIYSIYSDDDYSGIDRDRPEWNKMLRDARAGKFQIVLCKNQSRFTRDIEMVEKYIHGLFQLWGIRFVALLDNVDTDIKGNKKARQINGLINEWYLEDLSENVKAVLDQKRRAGKFIGSFAPYGYQKDLNDHNHLVVDEQAAEFVRQIFEMFLQGVGTHNIAVSLNERGVLSPGKYRKSGGERCTGSLWHGTTVSRILKNQVYIGNLVQGRKRKAGYKSKKLIDIPKEQWMCCEETHEPIVGKEVFEAAQRRLLNHTRSSGTGRVHPLAGKLRCADCGSSMIKVSYIYKGERRFYLQCAKYADTRKAPLCSRHSIRLEMLTNAVEEKIQQYVKRYHTTGDMERFGVEEDALRRITVMKKEIAQAHRHLGKVSETVRSLYMDKVEGVITQEQFLEMNEDFLAEKLKLQAGITAMEQSMEELKRRKADTSGTEERVREILALNTIGRELYDLMIESIEIGEKDVSGNTQEIRINWKI